MIAPWYGERLRTFDRFDKMMGQMLGDYPSGELFWSPNIDVKEDTNKFTFFAELPGMKLEDVNVSVDGHVLSISGTRHTYTTEKGENLIRRECSFGKFERTFALDSDVKPEQINANFKDGILQVTVPKTTAKTIKRVPVKAG
ncbi:MAG TPA: Hsp20/alpha crystallin family protein [Fimbriimonadaceae bacterium]|nr:Hsp20/alpha crystallin family protein [Fimbriimonadaceae bacterium]